MAKPEMLDKIVMVQMSGTVPFRCPRCGYILHGMLGTAITCPACFGQGLFTEGSNQPGTATGTGSVIQLHRGDEAPGSG